MIQSSLRGIDRFNALLTESVGKRFVYTNTRRKRSSVVNVDSDAKQKYASRRAGYPHKKKVCCREKRPLIIEHVKE